VSLDNLRELLNEGRPNGGVDEDTGRLPQFALSQIFVDAHK